MPHDFQQRSLFETDPTPWELDAAADRLVARIVFPEGPAGEFDYEVPDALAVAIAVGCPGLGSAGPWQHAACRLLCGVARAGRERAAG